MRFARDQPAEYPFALNYFTGSKEHNIEMRNRALKRGWTLNEYRLAPLPPEPGIRGKSRTRFLRSATKRTSTARSTWISFRRSCGKTAANSRPPRTIPFRN